MEEKADLTEDQKLQLRPGLARMAGCFARVARLGMVVAHNDEDRRILDEIASLHPRPTAPTPDCEPTLLTDEEFLLAFDALVDRYKLLAAAHSRGMIQAHNEEQRQLVHELHELLAPARRDS